MELKEQNRYKRSKSFEEQLKDFMEQSDAIQKDISRRNSSRRRKRRALSKPQKEDYETYSTR